MHTSFAISIDGLPLGLLDQKINTRPEVSKELKKLRKRSHNIALPIEEKESIRWLESLVSTIIKKEPPNLNFFTNFLHHLPHHNF